jgi:ubiquitin-protein ligase
MHKIIARELRSFEHFKSESVGATIANQTGTLWSAFIVTDIDSVYGLKRFDLEVTLPPNYPFSPLLVRFVTPVKHEFVTDKGYVNLDVLGALWTPALSIAGILISIVSMLNECDMDYLRSRQIERQAIIKEELVSTVIGLQSSSL